MCMIMAVLWVIMIHLLVGSGQTLLSLQQAIVCQACIAGQDSEQAEGARAASLVLHVSGMHAAVSCTVTLDGQSHFV